jgi:hypothetical protein
MVYYKINSKHPKHKKGEISTPKTFMGESSAKLSSFVQLIKNTLKACDGFYVFMHTTEVI